MVVIHRNNALFFLQDTKTRLSLGQLPPQIEERDLREYFCKYGELTEVGISKDSRLGYVEFKQEHWAQVALSAGSHFVKGVTITCTKENEQKASTAKKVRINTLQNSHAALCQHHV